MAVIIALGVTGRRNCGTETREHGQQPCPGGLASKRTGSGQAGSATPTCTSPSTIIRGWPTPKPPISRVPLCIYRLTYTGVAVPTFLPLEPERLVFEIDIVEPTS